MKHEITLCRTSSLLALTLVGTLGFAAVAPPAIGVAMSNGAFQVDNAKVFGNGTVFDGSALQTGAVSTELRLNSGRKVQVGPESQVRVYRDSVEALGLKITPETASSSASVTLAGRKHVHVAALQGGVVVAKNDGMIVARLEPGRVLDFEPQAGADMASRVKGRLVKKAGRYFVKDESSNVNFELTGSNLQSMVGKTIEVTGTLDQAATGAAPVLHVMTANVAAGSSAAAAGATFAGIGMKAIVAGVVVAGVGGTAAAVALTRGDDAPISK